MSVQARRIRFERMPILAIALCLMVIGVLGGLARLGLQNVPGNPSSHVMLLHGPLMILGFLGTVISLERAVARRHLWGYLAPTALLVGTALLLAGAPLYLGQSIQLLGIVFFSAILVEVWIIQRNRANETLVLASVMFGIGTLLWMLGQPIHRIVVWWCAFLVLTILGERLELAAMGRLTARGTNVFLMLLMLVVVGASLVAVGFDSIGMRVTGVSYLGFAFWLASFDIARHTVRRKKLPRFVAWALLPGYVWLGVGGILFIVHGMTGGGALYDAQLHAVLLGFVFSMIFGHAPIIFPAILGVKIPYRRWFYIHLVMMHVGVGVRVAGDLMGKAALARYGAAIAALAIATFLLATIASAATAQRKANERPAPPKQ